MALLGFLKISEFVIALGSLNCDGDAFKGHRSGKSVWLLHFLVARKFAFSFNENASFFHCLYCIQFTSCPYHGDDPLSGCLCARLGVQLGRAFTKFC